MGRRIDTPSPKVCASGLTLVLLALVAPRVARADDAASRAQIGAGVLNDPTRAAATPPSIDREAVLGTLRQSTDLRGLKATEIVVRLRGDQKTRHRIRRLISELLEDGVIERGPGGRYSIVGWQPTPAAEPVASAPAPGPSRVTPAAGVSGRILVHPAGYGFVERDDGDGSGKRQVVSVRDQILRLQREGKRHPDQAAPRQHEAEALVPDVPGRKDGVLVQEVVGDVEELKDADQQHRRAER